MSYYVLLCGPDAVDGDYLHLEAVPARGDELQVYGTVYRVLQVRWVLDRPAHTRLTLEEVI